MPFTQKALIAGVIVASLTALVGSFVNIKKLAGVGAGLSHGAFGGLALAELLKLPPTLTATIFTIFLSLGITVIGKKTAINADTLVGIIFSGGMAIGIVILAFVPGYTDVLGYLFGSILAVSAVDIFWASCVLIVSILFFIMFGRIILYSTFDRDNQLIQKIPVDIFDYLLMVLIALSIVISIKLVGIILCSGLLVLPTSTAFLLNKNFFKSILISIVLSIGEVVGGIILSIAFDLPTGATIVLLGTIIFVIVFILKKQKNGIRKIRQ